MRVGSSLCKEGLLQRGRWMMLHASVLLQEGMAAKAEEYLTASEWRALWKDLKDVGIGLSKQVDCVYVSKASVGF